MKKLLIVLIVICIFDLSAQENNQTYGLFFGYNRNIHYTNFQKIPDVPNCCPKFEYGYGNGYNYGILFEQKLIEGLIIGARLGYDNFNATISTLEPTKVIMGNTLADGEFEHSIKTTISHYQLSLQVGYVLFADLRINGGFFAGMYGQADYSQNEKITKPQASATFIDSLGNDTFRRIRNEFSGSLKEVSKLSFGALFGLSYDFPLNSKKSIKLTPEAEYQYFFNDIAANMDWKISAVKFGLAIKYSPIPKPILKEIFKRENNIDTITIENDIIAENTFIKGKENINSFIKESETEVITTEVTRRTDTLLMKKSYKIEGTITAVGVDKAGKEIPKPIFSIEEYISKRLDPLLNYIFFDNNIAILPVRYKLINPNETGIFEIDSLYRETTLDIYYHILNIIGKRMTENPTAKISIIGCISDIGDEKDNVDLTRQRTEAVRDYLVNVWKISSFRIALNNKKIQSKVSTPLEEADIISENRRVEIYSDNGKILEPIFIQQIARTANPPIVRFKPTAKSDADLKCWDINAYQNSDTNNKFIFQSNDRTVTKVDWELDKFQKIIPKSPEPIIFSLKLEDVKGNKKIIDNKSLPFDVVTIQKKKIERVGNYEIDKFSLILFDFDKSSIEGRNKSIIDFINARIKPESQIEIRGYTDRTGEDRYNEKLSEKRAQATKLALKRQDAIAVGIGEEILLYNNDLPEGRFYSRTVEIIVKTLLENK
jgi:outer membrane protein OmpA-like peptidoglycan-associated protein